MNILKSLVLAVLAGFLITSCKNDSKVKPENKEKIITSIHDSKALEGTGANDMSGTFKLVQYQKLQEGNVGFHFKSQKLFEIYVGKYSDNSIINFDTYDVISVFGDTTTNETIYKVESLNLNADYPSLNVSSSFSGKKMSTHRPSLIITVPKDKLKNIPVIKLNGKEIAVTSMS